MFSFSDACSVSEEGTGETKPCIFPFNYNEQTFTGCTTVNDRDYKAWCSTEVDSDGNHVLSGGFWGHCGPECENLTTKLQAKMLLDISGNVLLLG
jgi:hypothetical protein